MENGPLRLILIFLGGTQLAEFSGYFWHRWVCHLGLLKWLPHDFLRRRHYSHHMEKYPPEKSLQSSSYLNSCEIAFKVLGVIMTIILITIFLSGWINIINLVVLYLGMYIYAKYIMGPIHELYHLTDDQVKKYKIFQYYLTWKIFCWLRRFHDKHHLRNCNYSILNPLPDIIFGTYISPNANIVVEDIFPNFNSTSSECGKRVLRK